MLNSEKALFALNDVNDSQLESARYRLGYRSGGKTSPVHRKKLGRILLIAAVISTLLAVTAYATDFLGLRALRVEGRRARMMVEQENGAVEWVENPAGAVVSITQPQDLPEGTPPEVREKVENSRAAWEEWQVWHKENGLCWPEVYDGPEGTSFSDEEEQEDGSFIVRFYAFPDNPPDPGVSMAHMEQGDYSDFILLDERVATKEEHEQNLYAMDAISMGYKGYDYKYGVNTKEEADKLEEIAAGYGLDLRRTQTTTFGSHADYLKVYDLPEGMDRETWLSLDYNSSSTAEQLERLSAGTSCGEVFRTLPDYIDHLYYFQEGSFGISGATRLNGRTVSFYLYNSRYGTLSNGLEVLNEIQDVSAYSARTHQAPDGTEVTILTGAAQNSLGAPDTVYLYTYLEDSFVAMTLDSDTALTEAEIDGFADSVSFASIGAPKTA